VESRFFEVARSTVAPRRIDQRSQLLSMNERSGGESFQLLKKYFGFVPHRHPFIAFVSTVP
jgi:hypothetical protein